MVSQSLILVLLVASPVLFMLLGAVVWERFRKNREAGRTLLVGIDTQRGDLELRYVKVKDNKIVWGVEKGTNITHDGIVMPGEGAGLTLNGSGRAFLVNRRTLRTMRVSSVKDEVETTPEDGWQVGMYAVGVHERNIARPSGGTWLDTLASYTPVLVIGVGIIMVVGIVFLSGKIHA